MKINWGTGLLIGMLLFIGFIMYFVVTMLSSKEYDHDLVVEDYYRAELYYQQDIDAEKNALAMEDQIEVVKEAGRLVIRFPKTLETERLAGKISFYRPSNKMLDFEISSSEINENEFIAPDEKLVQGRWNINIYWQEAGKDFLVKKELIY
ncbi:FixH family protein [Gramella sp. GC03-9]|uniref:FixH family protein n=1 Tax=Christiangramia oceanisediminis TaxID=2920386 RepID=A0A9X2KVX6_9FLAO|nr:FixH family protein [Gramella oceanisediminis]MCP9199632.1 FixH family protein [Gramella oceanisediminis]